jgi:hypothetical protein
MNDAVDMHRRLSPQDPIESILGRLIIAVTNLSMDCLGRATQCHNALPALDLNLKYGMKGAAVVAELVKVFDSRRGHGPKKVTVGNVNVEAGGQAIVGNLEAGDRQKQTNEPQTIRRAKTKESDD